MNLCLTILFWWSSHSSTADLFLFLFFFLKRGPWSFLSWVARLRCLRYVSPFNSGGVFSVATSFWNEQDVLFYDGYVTMICLVIRLKSLWYSWKWWMITSAVLDSAELGLGRPGLGLRCDQLMMMMMMMRDYVSELQAGPPLRPFQHSTRAVPLCSPQSQENCFRLSQPGQRNSSQQQQQQQDGQQQKHIINCFLSSPPLPNHS
jgi:hypothetical protein